MICNIRGGLGTQVLSFLVCCAHALEQNKMPKHVVLNFGNYSNDLIADYTARGMADEINCNFLPKVLDIKIPIQYDTITGTNKTNIHDKQTADLVSKHIKPIRQMVKVVNKPEIEAFLPPVMHVRGMDRALLSEKTHLDIFSNHLGGTIIGDDPFLNKKIRRENYVLSPYHHAINDWIALTKSKQCIGPYSTFTLAAALLTPSLKLDIVPQAKSDGPAKMGQCVWNSIGRYVKNFDNVNWRQY